VRQPHGESASEDMGDTRQGMHMPWNETLSVLESKKSRSTNAGVHSVAELPRRFRHHPPSSPAPAFVTSARLRVEHVRGMQCSQSNTRHGQPFSPAARKDGARLQLVRSRAIPQRVKRTDLEKAHIPTGLIRTAIHGRGGLRSSNGLRHRPALVARRRYAVDDGVRLDVGDTRPTSQLSATDCAPWPVARTAGGAWAAAPARRLIGGCDAVSAGGGAGARATRSAPAAAQERERPRKHRRRRGRASDAVSAGGGAGARAPPAA
jgi:hypothetical protein